MFGQSELNLETLISSRLFLPDSPEPVIKLINVHKLIYLYIVLILLPVIVLIYERIKDKNKKLNDWKGIQRLRSRRRRGIIGLFRRLCNRIVNRIIVV